MKNLYWNVVYWCLINLQEMANDQEQETVIENINVVALIPYIVHALGVN